MNKKLLSAIGITLTFLFASNAIAAVAKRYREDAKEKTEETLIRSEAGLNIPDWGIAIDASYDPRLDNLIPGYKIVNLILTNRGSSPVTLDPKGDRWQIIDNAGRKHTAENHVRDFDKKLWSTLPDKLKSMLAYPNLIKPGQSANIDVFLEKDVDLHHFREVIWKSDHFAKEFTIFTNYESQLALPSRKVFDTPKTGAISENELINKFKKQDQQNQLMKTDQKRLGQQPAAIGTIEDNSKSNGTQQTLNGFIRYK